MKKVLITGGAGFIGLHLAKYYLSNNYKVDIIDNFSRGANDKELSDILMNNNITLLELDLMETKNLERLPKDYELVFHLAAIIGVQNVLKQPYEVLKKNVILLLNMLEWAKKLSKLKRFLFASTSEVYAGTLSSFEMKIPTPETTPLCVTNLSMPRTSYMLSKIYGEALCNQSGLPITNFRPHNIYGPRMGMAHVIPELIKRAYYLNDADSLDVYSAEHKRTFCYIDDAVKILYKVANTNTTLGKTINLGNQSPEISMLEVAKIVLKTVGKTNKINFLPPTEGSPLRRCPDMTKTSNLIGYKAEITLEDGILKTFNWYKNNLFAKKE